MNTEIIIFLILSNIVSLILASRERKDLLDRIMSRSFTEYKDNEKLEDNDFGDEESNLIDLNEAKEEING